MLPIKKTLDRIPGGLMLVPLFLGALVNTLVPWGAEVSRFVHQRVGDRHGTDPGGLVRLPGCDDPVEVDRGGVAQIRHPAADQGRRERGWPPPEPGDFDDEIENGSLYVGSPETVAQKVAETIRTLRVNRFDLKFDQPVRHEYQLESIQRYGDEVVPMVKKLLG